MSFKKKSLFAVVLIILFHFNLVYATGTNDGKRDKPNIVIFLVDDMGLMDTSVQFIIDKDGNPIKQALNDFYRTPNMEILAETGIRFSNFYAHSVCSPTRTSLMTGQNSARHRVTNWVKSEANNKTPFGPSEWNWEGLNKFSVTLPKILQQAGYKTIHAGKAHFGPIGYEGEDPLNIGFDINIAGNSFGQPGSYYGKEGFGHITGNKSRAVPGLEKYHGTDIFLTEALTLEANIAISNAKKEGKPFFLYMAHYAVHAPFHSDPRFAKNYKKSGKSKKAQAYATLIEGIDKSLGDIVQHINKLGLGKNTMILFLGDNGSDAPLPILEGYSSSVPLKGKKGNHWEGGMRVPFIASWATPQKNTKNQQKLAIPQNTIQPQMGTIFDVFSTVCDLAGANPPKNHKTDGKTLNKQLEGKKDKNHPEVFLNHFPHAHRTNYFSSIVKGEWKVIYHYQVDGNPRYELFNLKNDPFEANDLSNKYSKQLKAMLEILTKELENNNALYPQKEGKELMILMPL
jgi:arylsulfatase A-like enzyme